MASFNYQKPLIIASVWLILASMQWSAWSQELRYVFKEGQKFAYAIEVTADLSDSVETLKGMAVFEVSNVTPQSARLTYSGGLGKSTKAKSTGGSSRPGFGPPRGPIGPPPGLRAGPSFFNNPFSGLTQSTNKLTLSPSGEVLNLEGSSQLPYLLGNLSMMFFEPLPPTSQQSWSTQNGVTIREGGRSSRPSFMLPSPFDEPEKQSAAAETTEFTISNTEPTLTKISKKYKLKMPASGQSQASFEVNGEGTWCFNRTIHLADSIDFKQTLVVQDGNTTVTIPVVIRYNLLSDVELKKRIDERDQQIAEARQRAEDQRTGRARPIAADEKQKIVANLNSGNKPQIASQMVQLKIMKPHPDDKDIALLIQKYLEDSDRPVRVMAQAAWEKWKVLVEGASSGEEKMQRGATAKEADNPFELPSDKIQMRTWKDSSGKFNIEAEFVSFKDGKVSLKRKDGEMIVVPLERLSEEDQVLAKKMAR